MTTTNVGVPSEEDYLLLGLKPYGGQSVATVKAAFKTLAARVHPDVPNGDTDRFRELHGAYERVMAAIETPLARLGRGRRMVTVAIRPPPTAHASPRLLIRPRTSRRRTGGVRDETSGPPPTVGTYFRRAVLGLGRLVFLSRRWPETELAVAISLVLATVAGVLVHEATRPGFFQAIVEIAPGFFVVIRAITVRDRLERRLAR